MSSLHARLRRQMPSLTPPFAGDDEDRLLGTMRESVKPPDETKWLKTPPSAAPDPFPAPDSTQGAGIGNQPMPRIHLGVSTKGLQGVERDLARVQAARDFDREGTGFKVTPDFVEQIPKDPHRDWKDRLKSLGKTAVISMANIKKSNPDASATELLAGGATGGAIGAISPDTGDAMFRRAQIEDMESQLAPQIARERAIAQTENERLKPQIEAEKVRQEQEHRRKLEEIRVAEEQGRITRDEANRKLKEEELKERKRQFDLSREDKANKPEKIAPAVGKYEAAKQLLNDLGEQEKAAGKAKESARLEWMAARGRYDKDPDIQQDVIAAKRKVDEAQKYYESFWGLKNKAKADMKKYEPRQVSGSPRGNNPAVEQKIRDAAKAKGLDPDEAVKRYRSGKY